MRIHSLLLITIATLAFSQSIYHLQPTCNANLPSLVPYLTQDFQDYLEASNLGSYNFTRTDLNGGSYGGRHTPGQALNNTPIIFFHGAADVAIGNGTVTAPWQTGFRDLIQYLIAQGYNESELYITSWGNAILTQADNIEMNYTLINYLRTFTEAVINYTNASSVNVVAHSLGVDLARKVIKGGNLTDSDGTVYNIGEPLSGLVESFIAIAGANWGLDTCEVAANEPVCNDVTGLYPGNSVGQNGVPDGLSVYLEDINENGNPEAAFIGTLYNYPVDSVLGPQLVFGHNTSQIAYEDGSLQYNGFLWTHFDLRDGTCGTVLNAIQTQNLKRSAF